MIRWFARNGVAANLLMITIICLGLHALAGRVVLEVFPEFESEVVRVTMSYPGATPSEVEEGILIKIEEAIQDLVGIEELRSTASEGSGQVSVEVADGTLPRELLDDIKNRVDAINTFPDEAERPVFSIPVRRREVIGVVVSGQLEERELRELGERVRDELTGLSEVSQVDLTEIRPWEISIELPEDALRAHGLRFSEVLTSISRSSLDLPAGALKTRGGEIRLRTKGQSYTGRDFEQLVILKRPDGTQLRLGDIARIRDSFEEEPIEATFNGEPCVVLEVYRVGAQNAIDLAAQVRAYVTDNAPNMPPGVKLSYWRDRSVIIEKRLQTLLTNALQGALLVVLVLGLFLRPTVAFWVTAGIPVSFLGALALMPTFGITVNIMSVFAFILVLGIVVDDAIVTGENIYTHLKRGSEPLEAVIQGTQEIAVPVTFGVLTTVVAFIPLALMGGRRGPIFAQIPWIVIPVLLISLLESKLVLPSHLRHLKMGPAQRAGSGALARLQGWIADRLEGLATKLYKPLLHGALRTRYLTVSVLVAGAMVLGAYVFSGQMRFVFFPRIQSEVARGNLLMPEGTSFEMTSAYIQRMAAAAQELRAQVVDPATGQSVIRDILATAGSAGGTRGQSNLGRVTFEITPPEDRSLKIKSTELVARWRALIGPLPGVRDLSFRAEIGRGGDPIDVQLQGRDLFGMREVAGLVKERLAEYPGIFAISDSFQEGKPEMLLRLKPEAELLGLSVEDLARQVRQGFFGAEAQRVQRGRDDVKVSVRYLAEERDSLGHLEAMSVRTPDGVEVPFSEVAEVEFAVGFASITRIDRQRILNVTADVNKEQVDVAAINTDLRVFLDELLARRPGLGYALKGEAEEQADSFSSLGAGLLFVLLAIYVLLAIPFRSYVQPLLVMAVIPFGWAGAVVGHMLMDMPLSIFSVLGMLALTGVVVNDSLVLVDFVNRLCKEGHTTGEAVRAAGVARFRAILLTSLTTFVGLMPLIFEKSTQAQFLIPMAVSLGFGVLFSTFVTLLLVPVLVLVFDDHERAGRWLKARVWDLQPPASVPGEAS